MLCDRTVLLSMESLSKVVSEASLPLKLLPGVALSHAVVTLQALSYNGQPSPAP